MHAVGAKSGAAGPPTSSGGTVRASLHKSEHHPLSVTCSTVFGGDALGGNETSSGIFAEGFIPSLSSYLDWIPWAGEWRGIAQVEVIQLLDLHAVVEGGGKNIYTFGDFRQSGSK